MCFERIIKETGNVCTIFCPSKLLHEHCFQFLLGLKTNWKQWLYKILKGQKRVSHKYGKFENGLSAEATGSGHLFLEQVW